MCVLPYQSHVRAAVHRVTEDVALHRGFGILDPQENRVAGAQTDLWRESRNTHIFHQRLANTPIKRMFFSNVYEHSISSFYKHSVTCECYIPNHFRPEYATVSGSGFPRALQRFHQP